MDKYFKFFLDEANKINKVEYSPIDQKGYFEFVKSQYEKGFKQVIITSKMMLEILSYYFYNNYRVNEIEFCEEDYDLDNEIRNILLKIERDRGEFNTLLKKLDCIAEDSSIDIAKIKMTSLKQVDNKYFSFTLRVNGIFSVNNENLIEENKILKIIKESI